TFGVVLGRFALRLGLRLRVVGCHGDSPVGSVPGMRSGLASSSTTGGAASSDVRDPACVIPPTTGGSRLARSGSGDRPHGEHADDDRADRVVRQLEADFAITEELAEHRSLATRQTDVYPRAAQIDAR